MWPRPRSEEESEHEMVDILHRVGITAPREAVYQALTVPEEMARWWTTDTSGAGQPGDVLQFRFDQGAST